MTRSTPQIRTACITVLTLATLPASAMAQQPQRTVLDPVREVLGGVTGQVDALLPAPVVQPALSPVLGQVDALVTDVVQPLPVVGAPVAAIVRPVTQSVPAAPSVPTPQPARPLAPAPSTDQGAPIPTTVAPSGDVERPTPRATARTPLPSAASSDATSTTQPARAQASVRNAASPTKRVGQKQGVATVSAPGTREQRAPDQTPVPNDRGASPTPTSTPVPLDAYTMVSYPPVIRERPHHAVDHARAPPYLAVPASPD